MLVVGTEPACSPGMQHPQGSVPSLRSREVAAAGPLAPTSHPTLPTAAERHSLRSELSDAELLLLLLGAIKSEKHQASTTSVAWAERLLEHAGGLGALWDLRDDEFGTLPGVAAAQGRRLLAALELARRCLLTLPRRAELSSHRDVLDWALARLVPLEHEELWLLSLDTRNCLKRADRVAQGGMHGCAVTPRDVLRPAVRNGAAAVVVVHNHPSGDPTPSHDDLVMTRHLAQACDVLGIPLLDHVVVARGGSCSVAELGVLDLEPTSDMNLQSSARR